MLRVRSTAYLDTNVEDSRLIEMVSCSAEHPKGGISVSGTSLLGVDSEHTPYMRGFQAGKGCCFRDQGA